MIFLQGLEKVQVTIQTHSQNSAVAGINCNKMEMYKNNNIFSQTLQTDLLPNCCRLNLM